MRPHEGKFLKNFHYHLTKFLYLIIIMIIIIKMIAGGFRKGCAVMGTAGTRKYSRKRDEILALLRQTPLHPGARWIYEQLRDKIPGLSLGTVYRNLTLFCSDGQAAVLGVIHGEERFDAVTEPHAHVVCSCCGKVVDLPVPDEAELERFGEMFAQSTHGFEIDYRQTMFCGVCEECASGRHETRVTE
jgi:Fur family peroxide stress response transcriptional regulator